MHRYTVHVKRIHCNLFSLLSQASVILILVSIFENLVLVLVLEFLVIVPAYACFHLGRS